MPVSTQQKLEGVAALSVQFHVLITCEFPFQDSQIYKMHNKKDVCSDSPTIQFRTPC